MDLFCSDCIKHIDQCPDDSSLPLPNSANHCIHCGNSFSDLQPHQYYRSAELRPIGDILYLFRHLCQDFVEDTHDQSELLDDVTSTLDEVNDPNAPYLAEVRNTIVEYRRKFASLTYAITELEQQFHYFLTPQNYGRRYFTKDQSPLPQTVVEDLPETDRP